MSESKLRIKFGEHEFEIEGPSDHVERQFESFRRMVLPGPEPEKPAPVPIPPVLPVVVDVKAPLMLNRVMQMKGRMVFLTVETRVHEAVLAILLGQKHFRQNDSVSGMEIMSGLRESGFDIPRADTILAKHAAAGSVVASGKRKLRRYRLSTDGITIAEGLARQWISQLR